MQISRGMVCPVNLLDFPNTYSCIGRLLHKPEEGVAAVADSAGNPLQEASRVAPACLVVEVGVCVRRVEVSVSRRISGPHGFALICTLLNGRDYKLHSNRARYQVTIIANVTRTLGGGRDSLE
jgi:hypothetical protein